jgi:hypothetical protein
MLAGRISYPIYDRLWHFTPTIAGPSPIDNGSKYFGLYVMQIRNRDGVSTPITNLLKNVIDGEDTRPDRFREGAIYMPQSHRNLIDQLAAICRDRLNLGTTIHYQPEEPGKTDNALLSDLLNAFDAILNDYERISIVDLVCRSRATNFQDPLTEQLRSLSTGLFTSPTAALADGTAVPPAAPVLIRRTSDVQEEEGTSREIQSRVFYGTLFPPGYVPEFSMEALAASRRYAPVAVAAPMPRLVRPASVAVAAPYTMPLLVRPASVAVAAEADGKDDMENVLTVVRPAPAAVSAVASTVAGCKYCGSIDSKYYNGACEQCFDYYEFDGIKIRKRKSHKKKNKKSRKRQYKTSRNKTSRNKK